MPLPERLAPRTSVLFIMFISVFGCYLCRLSCYNGSYLEAQFVVIDLRYAAQVKRGDFTAGSSSQPRYRKFEGPQDVAMMVRCRSWLKGMLHTIVCYQHISLVVRLIGIPGV